MRRLLVVMALMLAGSAAITVAGEGPLAPEDPVPPAAEAVLSTVRSVLSPTPPIEPGPVPAVPVPAPAEVPEVESPGRGPGEQPVAAPEFSSEPAPAPRPQSAAADDGRCEPLTVTLSAGPRSVAAGDQSTLLVAIGNPGNRPLSRLSLTLDLSATEGVRFTVSSANPPADSLSGGTVVFDNLGRLGVGATRQVQVVVDVDSGSGAGEISGTAIATGDCERGPAGTEAVSGRGALQGPKVTGGAPTAPSARPQPRVAAAAPAQGAAAAPAAGGLLSRTGGLVGLAVACWLTAAGIGLQMMARSRPPRARRRRRAIGRPVRWMRGERR